MDPLDQDILDCIGAWPEPAQTYLLDARAICHDAATRAQVGALDESLKWGQPAWRPRRARTGSTLRLNWSPDRPRHIMAFVDCKTDLASEMSLRFPGQFENDGRRACAFDLGAPLARDGIAQLAHLTFTYHMRKTPR